MDRGWMQVGAFVLCAALAGASVPARADDGAAPQAGGEGVVSDDGVGIDWVEVVGWSLVGLGAAMEIAYAGYVFPHMDGLDNDPAFLEYRRHTPAGQDACVRAATDPDGAAAREVCSEADTLYAMGAVFFFGGLMAIAGGVTMLLLDQDPPEPRRVSLRGGIGPDGANVGVRVLF